MGGSHGVARTGEFGRARGGSFVVIWGLPVCNSSASVCPWLPGANCRRPRAGLRAKDGQPVEKSGIDVGAATVREWSSRQINRFEQTACLRARLRAARTGVPTGGGRFTGSRYVLLRLGCRQMPACQQQHRNNCSGHQELESDHDNTTVAGTTVVFVWLFKFTIVAEPGARPRTSVPTRVARQTTTHWRRPSS